MKETAEKALESKLKLECKIGTADVSAQDVAAANALNISVGRYLLFRYIAARRRGYHHRASHCDIRLYEDRRTACMKRTTRMNKM